jgi:hypothetical protein
MPARSVTRLLHFTVAGNSHHHRCCVDTVELCDRAAAEEVRYVLKVSLDLTWYEYCMVAACDHDANRYISDVCSRTGTTGSGTTTTTSTRPRRSMIR